MKNRYWLPPVFMFIGSWVYALICEQLPQNNKTLPVVLTFLLFSLTAILLNRTCTRKGVLISAIGLLIFCLILMGLDLLLSSGIGSYQLGLALAYLWEAIFFPYLSLPLPDVSYPLVFLPPSLIPFAWSLFCK